MAVWRDGVTGALGERAVDMTLRLDNAGALPTYPQPPQHSRQLDHHNSQNGAASTLSPAKVVLNAGSTSGRPATNR
jgi:hypothetical protein